MIRDGWLQELPYIEGHRTAQLYAHNATDNILLTNNLPLFVMTHNSFSRSFTLLEELVKDANCTPPLRADSLTEYLDRSLTVLGEQPKIRISGWKRNC